MRMHLSLFLRVSAGTGISNANVTITRLHHIDSFEFPFSSCRVKTARLGHPFSRTFRVHGFFVTRSVDLSVDAAISIIFEKEDPARHKLPRD